MQNTALVYVQYPQPYQQQMIDLLTHAGYRVHTVEIDDVALALSVLEHAQIALIGGALPKEALEQAPLLKWIHFDWVGVENMLSKAMFKNGRVIITNGSGRNSLSLAEHVFFFIFTLTYGTREIFAAQKAHHWGVAHTKAYTPLFGKTLLVVGAGSIGDEVAHRSQAFGMRTIGYSRTKKACKGIYDQQFSKTALGTLIKEADYVVLTLSLNAQTYHCINAELLQQMKSSAYLINISRGAVVDERALVEALKTGTIAGAGCDTFETEPLVEDSELWDLPNLVITPHSTPKSPLKFEQGLSLIAENLKRLDAGEDLLNMQTQEDILEGIV